MWDRSLFKPAPAFKSFAEVTPSFLLNFLQILLTRNISNAILSTTCYQNLIPKPKDFFFPLDSVNFGWNPKSVTSAAHKTEYSAPSCQHTHKDTPARRLQPSPRTYWSRPQSTNGIHPLSSPPPIPLWKRTYTFLVANKLTYENIMFWFMITAFMGL